MPELTPAERSMRARIAAHARWAKEDPARQMARAREGRDKRFLDEVDPDRVLPEDERNRRAEHARRAYFTRLALKSAQARRRAVEARAEAEALEAELTAEQEADR